MAPNGKRVNQIDNILVSTRFKNCTQNIITVRGADGDSDHYLVKEKMEMKIKMFTHKKGIVVDKNITAKLNDINTCGRFKYQMLENLKIRRINTGINDSIDAKWKKIKEIIKVVTKSEIGKIKSVKKPWFNDVCKDALNWKKEAEINGLFEMEKLKYIRKLMIIS